MSKLPDDLPGHGPVEGPHLPPGVDDLLLGQQEAVATLVAQLHGVAVGDPQLAQRPVQGPTAGHVQQAGDAAHLGGVSNVSMRSDN